MTSRMSPPMKGTPVAVPFKGPQFYVHENPDLQWSFQGATNPTFVVSPSKTKYKRTEAVDPTPCYSHDMKAVWKGIELAEATIEPRNDVHIFLPHYEVLGRTNGYAQRDDETYDKESKLKTWVSVIVLSGKRIPIHPGMTRYLVVHEYGHHVEMWLEQADGSLDRDDITRYYMELRGHKAKVPYYGPGTWHLAPGEIFANDFRILAAGVEEEYWPHPGVPHPRDLDNATTLRLIEFWDEAIAILRST